MWSATENPFGVNNPKTKNSVQKNFEIRIFCTEFLYFAYITKIESFNKVKSRIFVFFSPKLALFIQTTLEGANLISYTAVAV